MTKDYETGLRDGKIQAIEEILIRHDKRMDNHSARLRQLERIIWIAFGGLALIQALPTVIDVLGRMK